MNRQLFYEPMHFSLQTAVADMDFSMLLMLTAVTQLSLALTDSTLNEDQLHTVVCVWKVAHSHLAAGRALAVSMPRTAKDVARSPFSDPLPQTDNLQTVSVLLGKLHEGTRWPIELFRPSGNDPADTPVLHHSYILFVWNEEERSLNETLENQVENLKYSTSWNPRGRFLVVATDSSNGPEQLLAAHICSILWQVARIVNVVVLIPSQFAYRPLHALSNTKTPSDRLNLYTWFPFKLGVCGELQDVILLDEWVFENNVTFSRNANLYPEKVPMNFMGCPIKIGTIGIDPSVIMTENFKQNDGSTAYNVTGLSVEILKYVCEKLNLTYIFLPPTLNVEHFSYIKVFSELAEGLSEVAAGTIPLNNYVVSSMFDSTIPYIHISAKMFVPCPKAIPGTENLLTTFSLSVWLTIGLVLLLTTAVFWCAGNGHYRSVYNETHKFQSLSSCFQNAWAVLVAVSVPQQPTTSNLRVFFFLYVSFCFAINTVFQAFFVSYLVEPKYEKKIETLEELLNSDVVYGYYTMLHVAASTVSYPEVNTFFDHKELKEHCSDIRKCIERMIAKRDIAIINDQTFFTYLARELGTVDVGKIICPQEETIISGYGTVIFKKGNVLLDSFNNLMRRYLEAGNLERLWAEMQHRASLKRERFSEATGEMFFAFSISHIMPTFVVLLAGTVFSSVVFTAELIVNCLFKVGEKICR